ncbi:MAG: nucleoside 2-deoxyribosyltransferase [Anaerolineae bacterium]|nr:nucleoside 2-deoxyribosyltransferase [Anaerolineae bacterium]
MKEQAYIAIKYHEDHANRARIEGITRALEAHGLSTYCVARDLEGWGAVHFDPPTLMKKTFEAITASDLVVADLSEKGVGVGIEAGYAHAHHIPIVVIACAGSPISETLRGIAAQVGFYRCDQDLVQIFAGVRRLLTQNKPD